MFNSNNAQDNIYSAVIYGTKPCAWIHLGPVSEFGRRPVAADSFVPFQGRILLIFGDFMRRLVRRESSLDLNIDRRFCNRLSLPEVG